LQNELVLFLEILFKMVKVKTTIKHTLICGFMFFSFFLNAQTAAPDEDGSPYDTCNADGDNAERDSDDLGSPVNVGTIDDRTCYANYKETTLYGSDWGIYNITDDSNNQDAANTLQPRMERSLDRSQTTGIGSYAKLTGTVRILEVGNINGVSDSNDGTYIMQAKGKHTGEGGSADPAICLYLAKPVFSGGNQVSFDIYREQINYRGGSGADGRTLVYLTNITKNSETSIVLEIGFRQDPNDVSKKIHYSDATIGGMSYNWEIPEPERGLQSGIRYGAYRVKGGRAQIRWANTTYEKVENAAAEAPVASVQSWDFKTDLDPGDWVKGTQTLDAAIVADGLEVTWEASGLAGASPQNKPKIGITSGADINATSNKIIAVTLINNSSEPIDVQVKFPRDTDGTNKFYSSFDDIPANVTTSTTYYLDLTDDTEWTGTKDWVEMQLRDTGNTGRDNASSAGSIIFQKIEFIDAIPEAQGPTMTSNQAGDWDDPIWTVSGTIANTPSTTPTAEYDVIIGHDVRIPSSMGAATAKSITVTASSGAEIELRQNNTLTVTNNIALDKSDNGMQVYGQSGNISTIMFGGTYLSGKKTTFIKRLSQDKWTLVSNPTAASKYSKTFGDSRTKTVIVNGKYAFASYDDSQANNNKYSYVTTAIATGNSTMTEGEGYSTKSDEDTGITSDIKHDLVFTGNLNADDVSITLSTGGDGFNLVGNPYPTYLFGNENTAGNGVANNVLTVNSGVLSQNTLWFWDAATQDWVTKNQTGAFHINPLQGFFVKAISASSFNFTEAMQSHDSNSDGFLKTSKNRFGIDLSIANGKLRRSTAIKYIDDKTTSFDNGYDSSVFGGYASVFQVYTGLVDGSSGEKIAIQSLPNKNFEDMIVPVGVRAAANSEITFTAKAINVPSGYKVFLEDRLNNMFTRLDEAKSKYVATVKEAATEGRFYLHTRSSVLSVASVLLNSISIYKSNASTLRIVGLSQGKASVKLYNVLGKQVMSANFNAQGVKEIALPNLSKGIYIVQLETETGKLNKRIVLE
jgi:hypothetical protein